ncbi:MAG: CBS domain-containing protein [Thermodesulfovibrionales bacterium]|nr:CBS domain-containing protein [Thermodesulfovibrionales bacterium]
MSESKRAKRVKDIMVSISLYPHVPYWLAIGKAVRIIKLSLFETKKNLDPSVLLIFDEKYNLLGTVTLKNLLKVIEASRTSKNLMEQPVSEIMVPAEYYVVPDDSITKAAELMVHNELDLLPVLEDRKKFIGVVRPVELFDALSNEVLTEGSG